MNEEIGKLEAIYQEGYSDGFSECLAITEVMKTIYEDDDMSWEAGFFDDENVCL